MDKLTRYRTIIKKVLSDFAALGNRTPRSGDAETVCVFDEERDHYLVVNVGWSGDHRLRGNTLYMRLRNGKIWVEENWTDVEIVEELVRAGVPNEDIVLGFQPPEMRQYTDFAVA